MIDITINIINKINDIWSVRVGLSIYDDMICMVRSHLDYQIMERQYTPISSIWQANLWWVYHDLIIQMRTNHTNHIIIYRQSYSHRPNVIYLIDYINCDINHTAIMNATYNSFTNSWNASRITMNTTCTYELFNSTLNSSTSSVNTSCYSFNNTLDVISSTNASEIISSYIDNPTLTDQMSFILLIILIVISIIF
jgi:hypothetical protein